MITGVLIGLGIFLFIFLISAIAWYRIVDPSEAHLVVTPNKKFVASPDDKVGTTKTYFAIPSWIPWVGRTIRKMDVTIKEIVVNQETYEKNQARYNVKSSTKYRITNVRVSAETFTNQKELQEQLMEVIRASVRAVTVKYDVVDARAKKQEMGDAIQKEMQDDLNKWGLTLINFQLVDFADTDKSKIISDISKRREVEIETETREMNAEKFKQAKIKEADADEKAKQREIKRDELVGIAKENQKQKVAEQEKIAETKRFDVVQVQIVQQAKIDKEKAIVEANQEKETQAILKEKMRLEGEGYRLKAEEEAKGNAEPIRQKGLAEAEAKEKLQDALNKFQPIALKVLVAEQIVAKDQAIGVATAEALQKASVKLFAGTEGDRAGFDFGKLIESMATSNGVSADAILNKVARPNDLGMKALGLGSLIENEPSENLEKPEKEKKPKVEEKPQPLPKSTKKGKK